MLGHPIGIRILQNNLHKCKERTYGILNNPDMKDFTMLMIQEQYWSDYTKSSPVHHAWILFEPTGISLPERQPSAVIYINSKNITAAQITQMSVPSAHITAIQVTMQGATKPSLFINVYN